MEQDSVFRESNVELEWGCSALARLTLKGGNQFWIDFCNESARLSILERSSSFLSSRLREGDGTNSPFSSPAAAGGHRSALFFAQNAPRRAGGGGTALGGGTSPSLRGFGSAAGQAAVWIRDLRSGGGFWRAVDAGIGRPPGKWAGGQGLPVGGSKGGRVAGNTAGFRKGQAGLEV